MYFKTNDEQSAFQTTISSAVTGWAETTGHVFTEAEFTSLVARIAAEFDANYATLAGHAQVAGQANQAASPSVQQ